MTNGDERTNDDELVEKIRALSDVFQSLGRMIEEAVKVFADVDVQPADAAGWALCDGNVHDFGPWGDPYPLVDPGDSDGPLVVERQCRTWDCPVVEVVPVEDVMWAEIAEVLR